jgi:hypothetical protein
MRNALSYAPKSQQSMVSAALRQAFIQPDRANASQALRHVADQVRAQWPKLGTFIDESETDVLSHMDFPVQHRTKIHSTDEIDKPFRRDLLFWCGTGDRAAKSRARGCKSGRAAYSVAPHSRHRCAVSVARVAASAGRTARRHVLRGALHRSRDHAIL